MSPAVILNPASWWLCRVGNELSVLLKAVVLVETTAPSLLGKSRGCLALPKLRVKLQKSTERLWLGSKEGIGWNLVAVGKGEWWRGDQQENLGEGTVPQGQRGRREHLYLEEQLGWVSKEELPVIPGHILGRKGIAYTYLLPSQTRMIYTTSPSVSHSCSPTSTQQSFDGIFFFYPVITHKKVPVLLKMCVQKQSSSSLKDSILIILPTRFFWAGAIGFWYHFFSKRDQWLFSVVLRGKMEIKPLFIQPVFTGVC